MKMDPHPMLYPLEDLPPEDMARRHSDAGMRNAYRILWDNTLSYLSKAPLVREYRAVFTVSELTMACAGVEVLGKGWLHFQKLSEEAPPTPVPYGDLPAQVSTEDVFWCGQALIEEKAIGVATDTMISWLSDNRIASPGTLGTLLPRLQGAGWIDWTQDGRIILNSAGQSLLDRLRQKGILVDVESVRLFREILDRHEETLEMDVQETAKDLFASLGMALDEDLGWITAPDIPGHRASAELDLGQGTETLPQNLGYPPSMDPERLLPVAAPERQRRDERERSLRKSFGERWPRLNGRDRAILRLLSQAGKDRERLADLCDLSRFDILLRWGVGLPAADAAITVEEALEVALKVSQSEGAHTGL